MPVSDGGIDGTAGNRLIVYKIKIPAWTRRDDRALLWFVEI